MFCSGLCAICNTPCSRGEIKHEDRVIADEVKTEVEVVEEGKVEETGLSVPVAEYEVVKNIFGKEKVRRVK